MKSKFSRRQFLIKSSTGLMAWYAHQSFGLTGSKKSDEVSFGLVTDSHYADRPPIGERYYRDSRMKMRECVYTLNKLNLDFIIHLGDFKDEGINPSRTETLQFLIDFEQEYSNFEGDRFHVVGNHDVDSISIDDFNKYVVNTGIQRNQSYYSFDKGSYHFIVMDSNYDVDGDHHFFKNGSNWQDPNIPVKQIEWLENDLKRTKKSTIVFAHHPLFEYRRDGHQFHVTNYQDVHMILKESKKVIACFHGHVHEEKHVEIDKIHYCTLEAMVDEKGLENNSFYAARLLPNELELVGYRKANSFMLTI